MSQTTGAVVESENVSGSRQQCPHCPATPKAKFFHRHMTVHHEGGSKSKRAQASAASN